LWTLTNLDFYHLPVVSGAPFGFGAHRRSEPADRRGGKKEKQEPRVPVSRHCDPRHLNRRWLRRVRILDRLKIAILRVLYSHYRG
jgi:hypothetical protein